ncbi:MAG: glutaredoxin domain-containing protein [Chthoniobacterales bacterium]
MKIYAKMWCPWCKDAFAWLDARGFDYEKVDVQTDRAAHDRLLAISGQSLTPTLETDEGKVLADFDTRQLEKFLTEHKIAP